jgi:hypothetical protein
MSAGRRIRLVASLFGVVDTNKIIRQPRGLGLVAILWLAERAGAGGRGMTVLGVYYQSDQRRSQILGQLLVHRLESSHIR